MKRCWYLIDCLATLCFRDIAHLAPCAPTLCANTLTTLAPPLQVLDEDAMNLIRDRGEAPVFFEACLKLLSNSMRDLHAELDRQAGGYYKSDMQPTVYDLALGVRLAEASSQVWEVWGSVGMCGG